MYASLTCHPPLGQTTTIGPDQESVRFTVLIESAASSEKSWDVALWHNFEHVDKWTSLSLQAVQQPNVMTVQGSRTNVNRQYFTVDLPGRPANNGLCSYTITFRVAKEEPWKWANEAFSTSDGHLIYQSRDQVKDDLTHYIEGLPPFLNIAKEQSDTPDTSLWSITGPVKSASGKEPGVLNEKLGRPTDFARWFAVTRLWSPWLAPRQGKDKFSPDKDAILTAFERKDGSHLVLLPVSGIKDVETIFRHDGDGQVVINSQNDRGEDGVFNIIAAVGKTMELAVAAVMYYARRLVTQYEAAEGQYAAENQAFLQDFKPEWVENWYDGLTYCTWNSLGQDLTEEKIFNALDTLEKNGINISNMIIDDGWQSVFDNGMIEFDAHKRGFPRGLKATIDDVRQKHKNLKHIAVWHSINGYWGGIARDGKIAKEYKTIEVQTKEGIAGGQSTMVAEEDVNRFYNDFYQFLNSAGIDSVKTDGQFFLDEIKNADDRCSLIQAYQDAWNINVLRHFSARAISCMSQAPPLIFHSQLPNNKPRILLRNSDDFFPDVPASHPWHIFANAHNSVLTQHLNILPDWDMFQTSHDYAAFHAAGRCVSGGPVYITDVPGHHDVNLIAQMTGNTPRGDTVILRPHTVGKTTSAYNSFDDQVLLKVSTYVGMAHSGVSILGVFNCSQRPLTELIGLDSFPGAGEGTYFIRSHTSGKATAPSCIKDIRALVHVELPVRGWDILSAYPLQFFKLEREQPWKGPERITVAPLGILGKMTGAAAIVNTNSYIDRASGRLRIWTSLKVLGTYGIYVSNLKERSIEEDFFAVLFGRPIPSDCVKISDTFEDILELDLAKAWEETDQNASWSNEVVVEVVIR